MLLTRMAVVAFIIACGFMSTQLIASPAVPSVKIDLPEIVRESAIPSPLDSFLNADVLVAPPVMADAARAAAPAAVVVASSSADIPVVTAEAVSDVAEPQKSAAAEPVAKTLTVGKGDTLMKLLTGVGVSPAEAQAAIAVLKKHFDPRRMNIGQTIEVQLENAVETAAEAAARLKSLHIVPDYDRLVSVARTAEDAFKATQHERALLPSVTVANGRIGSSLYEAAVESGLPQPVLMEFIRAFSWDVDFQRDIQPGDTFEVMYEQFHDDKGALVHNGEIVSAAMTLSGQRSALYRFTGQDGTPDYYDLKGRSVRKALLRTPVDGARLSSGFGRRTHPILGYSKMHTGVDFAVPQGTPIYAAGDGTVEKASVFGGYGNYIRIRHTSEYATAYGHLSGYARGISAGKRIRQGEIIGYAGSTGMSTGPHLHYEILRNGRHTNPIGVRMPSGRQLQGREFESFVVQREALDRRYAVLAARKEVATRP